MARLKEPSQLQVVFSSESSCAAAAPNSGGGSFGPCWPIFRTESGSGSDNGSQPLA